MAQNDPPLVSEGRSLESIDYTQQVTILRARGCRCVLIMRDGRVQPLTAVEAIDCVIEHAEVVVRGSNRPDTA